jgi:hypothetical protein
VAFWIVVGALVITAVWSIATGTYFAFRDNVLTRLIGRQTELEFAYEGRIAQPRARVDRIMSRQLFDQEQFKKNQYPASTYRDTHRRSVNHRHHQTCPHGTNGDQVGEVGRRKCSQKPER